MFLRKNLSLLLFLSLFSTTVIISQIKNTGITKASKFPEVLDYFQKKGDKEQYEAAVFLVSNMPIHYAEDNIWLDKNGKETSFKVTNYKDIEQATITFNKLKDSIGMISRNTIVQDTDIIKSDLLIKNTEMAFKSWKENPWSKSYDFKTFCSTFALP